MARGMPRWIFLLLVLGAELIALTAPFDTYSSLLHEKLPDSFWFTLLHEVRPALITGLVVTLFFSWPIARAEFLRVLGESEVRLVNWLPWLITHLLLVAVLYAMTALGRAGLIPAYDTEIWLSLWVLVALATFATWTVAALPLQFWVHWLSSCWMTFLAGAALGLALDLLGRFTQALLWPFQHLSFDLVVLLLRLCGEPAIARAQQLVVETPTFSVHIGVPCSGLEGVGLISAFLAAYLWLFREKLRFPHALFLIPLGVIASWFFNAVRITILVLLASWNSAVGIKGFHSVGGWLFFNLVACALVWISWRFSLFTKAGASTLNASGPNPAAPFLIPFLAIIAASILTRAISGGPQVLFPLRVLAGMSALWFYRRQIAVLPWKVTFSTVALGAAVFLLWITLSRGDSSADITSRAVLAALPNGEALGLVLFRLVGAVIVVPLAEEFAFRGYLIRKLVDADFMSVLPGRFTWGSFLGSSVLFGLLHRRWIVGTLAGMIFAVALYRRGTLSDAVLAHATSNGLLSAYVLATGKWWLWS